MVRTLSLRFTYVDRDSQRPADVGATTGSVCIESCQSWRNDCVWSALTHVFIGCSATTVHQPRVVQRAEMCYLATSGVASVTSSSRRKTDGGRKQIGAVVRRSWIRIRAWAANPSDLRVRRA